MARRKDDLFGLEREEKIINSGVRNIYTPHRPVNDVKLFFGRQDEVHSIIEQINTPGQHSLLYGDRGVGKSSLANVASDLLLSKIISGDLYFKICDSESSFVSILREPLSDVGVDVSIEKIDTKSRSGGGGEIGIPYAKMKASGDEEESESKIGPRQRISPSYAAEKLESLSGLLVVDEADSLRTDEDKYKLAEFVKQLSDRDADFKVLIVGIAQTGDELTAGHDSVKRCLRETKLGRMSDDELREIIEYGEDELGIKFSENVKTKIIDASSGYPHFTHLLALKCAENAISEDRNSININHFEKSLEEAREDAEGTLSRSYRSATRSHRTNMYRVVLQAASRFGGDEFTAAELRQEIEDITGDEITQQSLNNYFKELVSDDGSAVLKRISKGVYKFSDPRMPSYVRISNEMI